MQDAGEIRRQPKTLFVAGHSHRYRVWPCMDTLPSVSDSVRERDVAAFINAFTQVALTTGSVGVARVSRYLYDSTHLELFGYPFGEYRYHSG
jgi:hypothetical protein